ncbi:unnamed protein product [Rodentolepis nana]|uniref:HECT-type E3 ubiquitin transferase n=1 Tax=Rodentolepis nana TaxID=102285 RepID=A0A158QGK5_RODNA|nr:unnamed protein product [Rodentolepis nana]
MSSVTNTQVLSHRNLCGIPFDKVLPGQRILKVLVVRGLSLMKRDIFGTTDPYCRLSLYRDVRQTSCLGNSVRTRTIKRSLDPEWNEEFYFRVNPESNRLIFEIFDENRITRDNFLGYVSISLPQTDIPVDGAENLSRNTAKSYLLKQRRTLSSVQGRLVIGLSYLPHTVDIRHTQITDNVLKMSSASSRLSLPSAALLPPPTNASINPSLSIPDTTNNHSEDPVVVSSIVQQQAQSSSQLSPAPPYSTSSPPPRPSSLTPPEMESSLTMSCSTITDGGVAENRALPEGWDERIDQNGRTYYVDHIHKRTQWDRPMSELPEGWERKTDACGRVYYIDHINHRTTWFSPLSPENEGRTPGSENDDPSTYAIACDVSRDAMDARRTLRHGVQTLHYQTRSPYMNTLSPEQQEQAAQTMYLRRHQVRAEDTTPQTEDVIDGSQEPKADTHDLENEELESTHEVRIPTLASSPGASGEVVPSSSALESTSVNSHSSPQTEGQQQQQEQQTMPPATLAMTVPDGSVSGSEQRISVVNHNDDPLPPGWQMALTANGRPFFINHNDQTTTWKDPRKRGDNSLTGKSETSITSVMAKDAQRHDMPSLGPLPPGWEERVHTNGRIFYINHNARATQWEDPRLERLGGPAVPYSRNYRQKYEYFRSRLRAPRDLSAKFEIRVTRTGVFEDSFRLIYSVKKPEILMHRLWIEFLGEKGLDYGGVQREWFFLLSREMFNPYYGLFEYSAADNYTLQINPLSGLANENHLRYFKFIGRVCGMAVYHGKLVDGFFIRPFYKMMLGRKIGLKDMESVDSEYYRSLKYILESDPRSLELTFAVDEEHFGETFEVELIPNGKNVPVTNANKRDYIERIINWRFVSRVEHQMCAFLEGFNDLIPLETLQLFDANELELLMCGLQDINVHDWKANTLYKGEYHANHPVIVNFWKTLYTFTNELRSRLLQFVTGTSRVPMNGFVELWGSAGPQKFTIESWGTPDQLPRAHTCFNRLDLPPYETFDELRCKLIIAIENAEGFEGVD